MADFGGPETPENKCDYWQAPIGTFNAFDHKFSFWLDAAVSKSNALCTYYLTELDGSLNSEWTPCGLIWRNPSYSDTKPWVEKATEQPRAQSQAVVILLPTDISTGWFILATWSADEFRPITDGRVQFVPASATRKRQSNSKGSLLFI